MKPSLQFVAGYVPDAFALPKTFVPENVTFGVYTFVPWVRSGLSAALEPPGPGLVRATVRASVTVRGDNNEQDTASKTLTLRGPGDVISLEAAQIIRRVPQRDALDAEENFLAHVEFDRPELPWLFSPRTPSGEQLPPWIALVVCDATVTDVVPGPAGFPHQLRTKRRELQPLDDSWAWAHAQILGGATQEPSVRDRLSASHGPSNLSRLLCPRRLESNHRYVAAVVPTFDCGVKAAMNVSGGTLDRAWDGSNPDGDITLPAFDWWRFSTAPGGDFEQLAGRLRGVAAPWSVGRRLVDASKAAPPDLQLPAGAPGATQVLKCALVSPAPAPPGAVAEGFAWPAPTRERLRVEVDRANAPNDALPRVGARLYARFQRGTHAVGPVFGTPALDAAPADADWFPQLNTSPLHRIVAGLGTRVVQRDQEPLMQAAWTQAAGIRKANHALVQMQFGRYVGEALHRNHFSKLSLGSLMQAVRGVQAKIRFPGSELTVEGAVSRSVVAPAATSAAFRRVARVGGPVARFASPAALRSLVATNDQFRDFRRPYREPEGLTKLSSGAAESFSDDAIGRVLGVDPSAARPALAARLAAWTGSAVTDLLAAPTTTWSIPSSTVDLGQRAAIIVDERVRSALPRTIQSDPARAEALAPLLIALRNTGIETIAARAERTLNRIDRQLPFSAPRRVAGLPTHLGRAVTARGLATSVTSAAPGRLDAPEIVRPIARLRFENEATRRLTGAVSGIREVAFTDVAVALADTGRGIGVAQLPRTPERPALALTRKDLLDALAPATTVTAYARARFDRLKALIAADWWDDGRVSPIMTAPRFDRAMFEALADYDRDWIVPGLGQIAFTDFVTVLSTNPIFTETFLIGLSDEMGRELLWRGYPTDQRGTYFHRFWSRDTDDLGAEIHRFTSTPLGTHLAAGASAEGCVVLVVRGELVRRYPEAVVVAMRAGGTDSEGRPQFTANPNDIAPILFHHHLQPDIRLVGFKLRPSQVQSEPWWFLITENPSGPRFGLDLAPPAAPSADGVARADLDWNDLGPLASGRFLSALARTVVVTDEASEPKTTTWPSSSAIVARTLLQSPVRAAFDAKKLSAPALA